MKKILLTLILIPARSPLSPPDPRGSDRSGLPALADQGFAMPAPGLFGLWGQHHLLLFRFLSSQFPELRISAAGPGPTGGGVPKGICLLQQRGGRGRDGRGFVPFSVDHQRPFLSCVDPTGSSTSCLYPANTSNRQVGLIIILEGVNDLGGLTPYDFIEANLRAMVTIALQNQLPVVMATILPVTSKPGEDRTAQAQRIYEFNPRIAQIAIDFQIPLVDFYSAFVNTPNWENLLITDDGLHPNDQGFELMSDVLIRVILPLLTTEGCYSG